MKESLQTIDRVVYFLSKYFSLLQVAVVQVLHVSVGRCLDSHGLHPAGVQQSAQRAAGRAPGLLLDRRGPRPQEHLGRRQHRLGPGRGLRGADEDGEVGEQEPGEGGAEAERGDTEG